MKRIDIGKVAKEHPEIIRDEIDKEILDRIRLLAKDVVPKVHKRKDGLIIE